MRGSHNARGVKVAPDDRGVALVRLLQTHPTLTLRWIDDCQDLRTLRVVEVQRRLSGIAALKTQGAVN